MEPCRGQSGDAGAAAELRQSLDRFGWSEHRNLRIDHRFGGGSSDQFRQLAKELVALQPEVIIAQSTPVVAQLRQQTHTLPVVFVAVSDPVGSGFIDSLARPGGNLTGLLLYEEGVTGKWMALLWEIAPGLVRVALLGNPKTTPYDYFVRAAKTTAPLLSIELVPTPIENAVEIERAIESLARAPDSALRGASDLRRRR